MYDPLTDPVQTDSSLGFFTRGQCVQMNLDFAHAMLSARKRGQEQFSIGAIVDNTPLVGTHFPTQPTQSLMSSSAATCVNAALGWEMPSAMTPVARRMPDGFK
jgi:hypothetical protein